MELKKIIYRRSGKLLSGKKDKIFICELTEAEYIEWVNEHKSKTKEEVLLEEIEAK